MNHQNNLFQQTIRALTEETIPIRQRILCISSMIGTVCMTVGFLLTIFGPSHSMHGMISCFVGLLVMLMLTWSAFRSSFQQVNKLSLLQCLYFNLFQFPAMYLNIGGPDTTVVIYFILGLIVNGVLLTGKTRIWVTAVSILWDCFIIIFCYHNPQIISVMPRESGPYITISGIMVVGISCVFLLALLFNSYDKLNSTLAVQATTDGLTGLYNRQYFADYVNQLLDSKKINDHTFLIIFDIDDFKSVNDRYGHVEGNRLLTRFASLMIEEQNDTVIPARFGGEEFVVLIIDGTAEGAGAIAERIRSRMEEKVRIEPSGEHITVSGGIQQYKQGMDADSFVASADARLYEAKHQGKNKIIQ